MGDLRDVNKPSTTFEIIEVTSIEVASFFLTICAMDGICFLSKNANQRFAYATVSETYTNPENEVLYVNNEKI